ncbi:MAG: MopE-related protein, partial [Proteobacteria bacterium]|nr:MopE-related protein [Pseudomonadota bacterium]
MSRFSKGMIGFSAVALFAALSFAPARADAQIKPRILILFDTSGSMTLNISGAQTYGDGTTDPWDTRQCCPGYGDSRLFIAKKAMRSMLYEAGDIDFALMKFPQEYTAAFVSDDAWRADWYGNNQEIGHRDILRYRGIAGTGSAAPYNYTAAGAFSTQSNYLCEGFVAENTPEIVAWMDNTEFLAEGTPKVSTFQGPVTGDYTEQELRGDGGTPLGEALEAARAYLIGVMNADPYRDCRPYSIIVLADGDYDGTVTPTGQVTNIYNIGGSLSPADASIHVKTWVIGLAITSATLNAMAVAGGTGPTAMSATSEATLTSALYTIVSESILTEICDGLDNDCDCPGDTNSDTVVCGPGDEGVDEGFELFCNWNGVSPVTQPAPTLCADPGETLCDGKDNNCDGETDEAPVGGWPTGGACGYPTTIGTCHPGVYVCAPGTGMVCQGSVYPAASDLCNGADEDCDGYIDNITGTTVAYNLTAGGCNPETGECDAATWRCTPTGYQCCDDDITASCVAPTTATSETCNDLDDDCDAATDEGNPGGGGACYPLGYIGCDPDGTDCIGECAAGVQSCGDDGEMDCINYTTPVDEICDGLDNDCAGGVDNFPAWDGTTPDVEGAPCPAIDHPTDGPCSAGVWDCNSALGALDCVGTVVYPAVEECNDIDDDCDGTIDDNNPEGGDGCYPTGYDGCDPDGAGCLGECEGGTWMCLVGGDLSCEDYVTEIDEICNAKDDDCDGTADDGDPGGGAACYPTGFSGCTEVSPGVYDCEGQCVAGVEHCNATLGIVQCESYTAPVAETVDPCNNQDDDCDGQTDEGLYRECGTGPTEGVCAHGQQKCEAGVWGAVVSSVFTAGAGAG